MIIFKMSRMLEIAVRERFKNEDKFNGFVIFIALGIPEIKTTSIFLRFYFPEAQNAELKRFILYFDKSFLFESQHV